MNFKTNKIILFCNRRITPQVAGNWSNSEYVKALLETVKVQAQNSQLAEVDFENLINYILYSLGNYYRGNMIFVFQLLVAFLYLITPVDIVNDFIPVIGYIDDLLLLKMILDTYATELEAFNKVGRDMLDIKYMRVEPKVVDEFKLDGKEAVELIIKDKKLEEVNGEELINNEINMANEKETSEYLNFDVIEIITYELINHLLKSTSGQESIDEELLQSLIQIPDIVSKKDISYFLKNINDILSEFDLEITREKKAIFNTNVYRMNFKQDTLLVDPQINFVQVDAMYNKSRQLTLKYVSECKSKISYEHIVEIIDLATQAHIFADTILYFEMKLDSDYVIYKIDKSTHQVSYVTSAAISNCLNLQLATIAGIIEERVI